MRAYAAGSCGSPHSSHSVIVSGQVGIEHRRDDVDERDLGDDRREQVGPQVRDRAHEQAARAAAPRDEPRRRRVALRDERLGARDEVGERVGLVVEAAVLVPARGRAHRRRARARSRRRSRDRAATRATRGTPGRWSARTRRNPTRSAGALPSSATSRRCTTEIGTRVPSGAVAQSARRRVRARVVAAEHRLHPDHASTAPVAGS